MFAGKKFSCPTYLQSIGIVLGDASQIICAAKRHIEQDAALKLDDDDHKKDKPIYGHEKRTDGENQVQTKPITTTGNDVKPCKEGIPITSTLDSMTNAAFVQLQNGDSLAAADQLERTIAVHPDPETVCPTLLSPFPLGYAGELGGFVPCVCLNTQLFAFSSGFLQVTLMKTNVHVHISMNGTIPVQSRARRCTTWERHWCRLTKMLRTGLRSSGFGRLDTSMFLRTVTRQKTCFTSCTQTGKYSMDFQKGCFQTRRRIGTHGSVSRGMQILSSGNVAPQHY